MGQLERLVHGAADADADADADGAGTARTGRYAGDVLLVGRATEEMSATVGWTPAPIDQLDSNEMIPWAAD